MPTTFLLGKKNGKGTATENDPYQPALCGVDEREAGDKGFEQ